MPVSSVTDTTAQSAGQAARATLTDNYETFLVLLTAQLQNQDPLSPLDSNQFTQQLVQYSQVEQQIRTNDQLESLIGQSRAASAGAALGYLGREAVIDSDLSALSNGAARWTYELGDYADAVDLEVRDANGRTVFSTTAAPGTGERAFSWDGRTAAGQTAADGVYQLVVKATKTSGAEVDTAIRVRETINGVDLAAAEPKVLTIAGARDLSALRAILDD
ncbi:MAG: hypothetical protein GC189_09635 [Alphaproteobacteria bacterium]|nr:hypothetical protein [Alphaproteobacteria bacterium]